MFENIQINGYYAFKLIFKYCMINKYVYYICIFMYEY